MYFCKSCDERGTIIIKTRPHQSEPRARGGMPPDNPLARMWANKLTAASAPPIDDPPPPPSPTGADYERERDARVACCVLMLCSAMWPSFLLIFTFFART